MNGDDMGLSELNITTSPERYNDGIWIECIPKFSASVDELFELSQINRSIVYPTAGKISDFWVINVPSDHRIFLRRFVQNSWQRIIAGCIRKW